MRWCLLLWCVACAGPEPDDRPEPDASGVSLLSIEDLRSGEVEEGVVDVGPVLVASPATLDGTRVYVSDPATGAGMEVRTGGLLRTWPVAVGRPVLLRVRYVGPPEAPVAWITDDANVFVVDGGALPIVREGIEEAPPFSLVRIPEVTVGSLPDTTGRADLSGGTSLDGRFGRLDVQPGAVGSLTGILTTDGRIAPRAPVDWVESTPGVPPAELTVAALRGGGLAEGTLVALDGVQATPWSPDGRYTVVQDPGSADGIWADAEGFFAGGSVQGTRRSWIGELRTVGEVAYVRLLQVGPPLGVESVQRSDELVDGAVVAIEIADLGPPDGFGRRAADVGRLVPRLGPLDDLPDPATVLAAVDRSHGLDLAVIAEIDPSDLADEPVGLVLVP